MNTINKIVKKNGNDDCLLNEKNKSSLLKKIRLKHTEIKNNIWLSPMAGYTDRNFRALCLEKGAGLAFTEMISAKGLWYQNKNTEFLLKKFDKESPFAVQIFGSDPKTMYLVSKGLACDIIDVNLGCPAPKIVKNNEGSALLKDEKLVFDIVHALSKTGKDISVKMRKSFGASDVGALKIATICEEAGASFVTIHGRTRNEFYAGHSDWETIAKVKKRLSIPVIVSGDVVDFSSCLACLNVTKADGVMIGRAALGNPWIFEEILNGLNSRKYDLPSREDKMSMLQRHTDMLISDKGERLALKEIRKHIPFYLKGFSRAAVYKHKLSELTTKAQLQHFCHEILNEGENL